jgi:hypothetical protein
VTLKHINIPFFFFAVLNIESKVLCMLVKYSTTELYAQAKKYIKKEMFSIVNMFLYHEDIH